MVCLIPIISPGPVFKLQRLPNSRLGLQLSFKLSSSLFVTNEPMKIAVGSILIPSVFKSKSCLAMLI